MKQIYKNAAKDTKQAFKQLLFPDDQKCEICGRDGDMVCDSCGSIFERHEGVLCDKCGRKIRAKGLCFNCEKQERPYARGMVALFYSGVPKQMMIEFKFHGKRNYARFFAEEIYKKADSDMLNSDVITAIPMHPIRYFGKGYNPPALIAKELSKMTGIAYHKNAIKRTRYTKPMSRLKDIDRMKHSEKNFAVGKGNVTNKTVLLIDDVTTTGATLHVCSELLMSIGAKGVFAVAACGDSAQY